MPIDPSTADRLGDQLAELCRLQNAAAARAARTPRVSPHAWRGPAFAAYSSAVDALASDLGAVAHQLGQAEDAVRVELAHALA